MIVYDTVQTAEKNPSKNAYLNSWNVWEFWTMTTKSLQPPSIPTLFPKCKIQVLQNSPKKLIQFLIECIVNLLHGNMQGLQKEQKLKYREQIQILSLVRTTWKERRRILSTKTRLLLTKTISAFVVSHLSWHGTVLACTIIRVQQHH